MNDERSSSVCPIQVLAELVEVNQALARATSDDDILAAVRRGVARFRPDAIELSQVQAGPDGRPVATELVAAWAAGAAVPDHPFLHVRLDDGGLTAAMPGDGAPDDGVIFVEEAATDPRLDEAFRGRMAKAGMTAIALLPLLGGETRTWHGVLAILWAERHAPSDEERLVARGIAAGVGSVLAARRTIARYQHVLAEADARREASDQLHAATTLEDALRATVGRTFAEGLVSAVLCLIDADTAGEPEWLEAAAAIGALSDEKSLFGKRFHIPSHPLMKVWTQDPSHLHMVNDVDQEEISTVLRHFCDIAGARSLVRIPLWRSRWVGVIILMWDAPRTLSEAERRVYQSLAGKVATVVENRQLMNKAEAALRENRRQRIALETILENLPVGVVVMDVGTMQPQRVNRTALDLFTGHPGSSYKPELTGQIVLIPPGTDTPLALEDWPAMRVMRSGERLRCELDLRRLDGVRVPLDIVAAPIRDEEGRVVSSVVLFQDIAERRRAEEERLLMQEELIRAQAAALAERSNPLIPISDDIVVMPLIGTIDVARSQQMLEVLLDGVSRVQARFAIIDVTGARTVDAQAANALTKAARALRLLGVEPVLTGIRAEVAQAMVGMGLDLTGVATRGTLQSGIAHARSRLGPRAV